MKPVTAAWIADAVGGRLSAAADVEVSSVEKDSRECTAGSLYVALPGERADGHDYVAAATAAGACLSLVTRTVDGPYVLVDDAVKALGELAQAYLGLLRVEGDIAVIGITGSVGKTTTKDVLAQVLPHCVAPVGSYNNEIGLPLTVLRADSHTRNLVLEMGANGVGHIAYLVGVAPLDIAVVLVVGEAHLGEYDSPKQLAETKAEILAGLVAGGTAILNAGDPRVAAMADRVKNATLFGIGHGDVSADGLTVVGGRARFILSDGASAAPVELRLVGEHHVTNALAAASVALATGMSVQDTAGALSASEALSAHRMAVITRADGVTIIDDSYNASPESMWAAMRALMDVAAGGRTVAVLGEMLEMGDGSRSAHADLGERVVRLGIDKLLVVGPGAKPTFDAAVLEGSWGEEAAYVATIEEARNHLDGQLVSGDTVLIKASHGADLWRLADQMEGAA